MPNGDLAQRFAEIRAEIGAASPKAMAKQLGIGENLWRLYEAGKGTPGWATLQKLAELGFNPTWLLTGQGEMRLTGSEPPSSIFGQKEHKSESHLFAELMNNFTAKTADVMSSQRGAASVDFALLGIPRLIAVISAMLAKKPFASYDDDLTGRALEAVQKVHAEAGIPIAPRQLGAVQNEMMASVAALANGPDEYPLLVELMSHRLRKQLAAARQAPGTGKRVG